jgi:hypothetical protein
MAGLLRLGVGKERERDAHVHRTEAVEVCDAASAETPVWITLGSCSRGEMEDESSE